MKIVLQPCGNAEARQHFADTIQHRVPMTRIQQHLAEEQFDGLRQVVGTDDVLVWGVTPARENVWRKLETGDMAAFCGSSKAFFVGDVCYKAANSELALELWGNDDKGELWEHLYFMTTGHDTNIPVQTLTGALGHPRMR